MSEHWTRAEAKRRENGFKPPVSIITIDAIVKARCEVELWRSQLFADFEEWANAAQDAASGYLVKLKHSRTGYCKARAFLKKAEAAMLKERTNR